MLGFSSISNGNQEISLTLSAPAKINLALAVSPQLADGKHLLESVFSAINLSDRLDFLYRPKATTGLKIQMIYNAALPEIKIAQPKNIVYKALRAFENRFSIGLSGDLNILVEKYIPSQAGLGGGSSDAATTLMALAQITGVATETETLMQLAAELGADVVFFLKAGCALMDRFGDRFVKSLKLPELDIVLVKPGKGLSASRVYQEFHRSPQAATDINRMVRLLENPDLGQSAIIDQIPNHMQNNLTDAAIRLVPELADTIDQLQDIPGIRKAQLTGSGTVVFGLAESREAAHRAASQFSAQGYWTSVCKTLPA